MVVVVPAEVVGTAEAMMAAASVTASSAGVTVVSVVGCAEVQKVLAADLVAEARER